MRKKLQTLHLFLLGLVFILSGNLSSSFANDLPPVTVSAANTTALINAIITARINVQETIINLTGSSYTISSALAEDPDGVGFPVISSGVDITINGNGRTIRRSSGDFRFFVVSNGILTLNDLTLDNGAPLQGSGGGAIYCSGGTVTLNRCTFTNNVSGDNDGADGGAIKNDGGIFQIQDCTFEANFASGLSGLRGGGIHQDAGSMVIIGSLFDSNSAIGRGGGLAIEGGNISLYNCTFFANGDEGIYQDGGTLDIIHCTITQNEANSFSGSAGGIVSESGSLSIINSIIADNDPLLRGTFTDISVASITDNGNNLVGNTFTGRAASTIIVADALLAADLGSNGGNTLTLRPASNSPAVDGATQLSDTITLLDQRGFLRDELPDIGAYELDASTPVASPYQVTSTSDAGAGTLREAINNANYAEATSNSPYSIDLSALGSPILLLSGLPSIKSNASITGSSANLTVIDGQNNGPILETKGDFSITLDNLDFMGGVSTVSNLGAILSNFNSQVSLRNCIFRDSQNAAGNADGIVYNSGGKMKFSSCLFQNNIIGTSVSTTAQGLLHTSNGTLELISCSIQSNSGSAGTIDGGGIFMESSNDSLIMNNCTIYNNAFNAQNFCFGGGIFIQNGYVEIINTTISGNDVSVSGGSNN
ncbi:MAG: right-handed parallel beta-helix repeat-containing protein, partial [Bacteroidota bacterium]